MSKEEILKELTGKNIVEVIFRGGSSTMLTRCEVPSSKNNGLWQRKVWGATGYLTDLEMAEELAEDGDDIDFIC